MRTRMPTQQSELPLDFGDNEQFASADDALDAAVHVAAHVHLAQMNVLYFSWRISGKKLGQILDFYGPKGKGKHCYIASQLLLTGKIVNDFDEVAWRIRRRCRELIASGIVTGGES